MTCVFKRGASICQQPASPECETWGVGAGFCAKHIDYVRARLNSTNKSAPWSEEPLTKPVAGEHSDYIEDYIKLYALMLDKTRCRELMTALGSEILGGYKERANAGDGDARFSRANNRETEQNYVRLSRVLEYYEGLCWFPTTHRVYTGSLTSENYVQSIALGYMPKDAGAGARHGEYSHRLQWHIVMRLVTNGFEVAFHKDVWRHSPFDMFTTLGSEWAMERGIWGVVFDNGSGLAYDNPAVLNMELCGNFKWQASKAEDDGKKWRSQNKLLAINATRRSGKRLAIFEYGKQLYKTDYSATDRSGDGLAEAGLEMELIGLLQKWKKLGRPAHGLTNQIANEKGNRILNEIAHQAWFKFGLQTKPNTYLQENNEPNAMLLVGDKPMTLQLVSPRVQASCAMLNTADYKYVETRGAMPRQ